MSEKQRLMREAEQQREEIEKFRDEQMEKIRLVKLNVYEQRFRVTF